MKVDNRGKFPCPDAKSCTPRGSRSVGSAVKAAAYEGMKLLWVHCQENKKISQKITRTMTSKVR